MSTITSLTSATTIDPVADYLAIDTASLSSTQKINRNTLLSLASAPVGLTDTQTLTNKTLTSPTINGATLSGTLSGTYTIGGTPTFPSTVVQTTSTQTLTNKTLTSPSITSPTITNATLSADAITGYTTSNAGTVYGVSITSGTIGSSGIATGAITASKIGTDSSYTWQSYTPTITCSSGTFTTTSATGRYIQIGKTVNAYIYISITTVGSATGNLIYTLPVTAESSSAVVGYGREDSTGGSAIVSKNTSTTQALVFTYNNLIGYTSGSSFKLVLTYEAA